MAFALHARRWPSCFTCSRCVFYGLPKVARCARQFACACAKAALLWQHLNGSKAKRHQCLATPGAACIMHCCGLILARCRSWRSAGTYPANPEPDSSSFAGACAKAALLGECFEAEARPMSSDAMCGLYFSLLRADSRPLQKLALRGDLPGKFEPWSSLWPSVGTKGYNTRHRRAQRTSRQQN